MIKTCDCEDFPCCGHGDEFPEGDDYSDFDVIDCEPDEWEEEDVSRR